jgi:hypothetical protein
MSVILYMGVASRTAAANLRRQAHTNYDQLEGAWTFFFALDQGSAAACTSSRQVRAYTMAYLFQICDSLHPV